MAMSASRCVPLNQQIDNMPKAMEFPIGHLRPIAPSIPHLMRGRPARQEYRERIDHRLADHEENTHRYHTRSPVAAVISS